MSDYTDHNNLILAALEEALVAGDEVDRNDAADKTFGLPEDLRGNLDAMNDKADSSATAAFTNLVTGIAIKIAYPDIDVRFHQIQIQDPQHFNHRGVSENVVYPFLRDQDFDGAKSGWQTRTLERPKPYYLDYDENIRAVKDEFLACYHALEEGGVNAKHMLNYLFLGQVVRRNAKKIDLIEPRIDDISTIIGHFEAHFFADYKSRGQSRLPVLALHSLYKLIMPELRRFEGLDLANLELHSAADSQTGATGDIEIKKNDGSVFEAIEVKHGIPVSLDLVVDAAKKLVTRRVDRFYVLTTHKNCGQTDEVAAKIKEVRERTGCQVIANGVIPTMRYYLRLVQNPADIFPHYTSLLKVEPAISHEHRVKWNEIVLPD